MQSEAIFAPQQEKQLSGSVLAVDDESHFLSAIRFVLSRFGITDCSTCSDGRQVIAELKKRKYDAVLLDMSMPFITGKELLPRILDENPDMPVIMITAVNEVETAVSCIKAGAFDYLVKPLDEERLAMTLSNAFDLADTRRENACLRHKLTSGSLSKPEIFSEFVTQNSSLLGIFSYIEAVAPSRQPVLITGETGTGKELVARAIHDASGRKGAYVPVNVAGIAEQLIDDELFGHCKGAFTGALNNRPGMIEQATGGTLFLDEIGDLSLPLQVKLLRLIQEGQYQPLGTDISRRMDARIVVATNHDIEAVVKRGAFRKDLYYRLNTHRIHLPSLRERKEDIPYLVDKFIDMAAQELGKKKAVPPRQLYTLLAAHSFPGNVRELRGMVFDAMSVHLSGTLSMHSFREKMQLGNGTDSDSGRSEFRSDDKCTKRVIFDGSLPTLKEIQELLIEEALKAADGNQTIAAGMLGMSRRALNSRLSRREQA